MKGLSYVLLPNLHLPRKTNNGMHGMYGKKLSSAATMIMLRSIFLPEIKGHALENGRSGKIRAACCIASCFKYLKWFLTRETDTCMKAMLPHNQGYA
jgi:hypothetical protein